MKVTNYAVAFALLYSSKVSAVQLESVIRWGDADDVAYNDYDKEYKPTALAEQIQRENYVAPYGRQIIDKDGDGVEDNNHKTQEELDRFRKQVFGAGVDDIHNTRHGNLPGHARFGDDPQPKLAAKTSNTTQAAKPKESVKLMSETDEIASSIVKETDTADSFYDREYVQTNEASSQELLSKFIDVVNSPDDLEDENLIMWVAGANKIYDADGDGVEDNVHLTHKELDRFYIPNRFFPTEDIHNTRNGKLPGHIQREFYENVQPEPESMDLVKKPWKKW
jgi:hypothetical protein